MKWKERILVKHQKDISIKDNTTVALLTVVKKKLYGLILEILSCAKHTSPHITSVSYSLDQIYNFSICWMPKITQRFLRKKENRKKNLIAEMNWPI